jgi:hypothetical protein
VWDVGGCVRAYIRSRICGDMPSWSTSRASASDAGRRRYFSHVWHPWWIATVWESNRIYMFNKLDVLCSLSWRTGMYYCLLACSLCVCVVDEEEGRCRLRSSQLEFGKIK